jgi:hypothetical protein
VETTKKYITDPNHAKLLSRINQHNRLAGTLGILPNHLIQLLRLTNRESLDNITEELRFTTFWATYDLWNRRQSLYRIYRNTLPDTLKVSNKEKKRKNLGKRKRRTKMSILDDCKNPFHYLLLRNPNKKPTQGTCDCSARINHLNTLQDNKTREPKKRKHQEDLTGLDHKYGDNNKRIKTQPLIANYFKVKSSADIIREEQDRSKRFKLSNKLSSVTKLRS